MPLLFHPSEIMRFYNEKRKTTTTAKTKQKKQATANG